MMSEKELNLHACGKHIEDHAKFLQKLIERRESLLCQTSVIMNSLTDNTDQTDLEINLMKSRWVCEFRQAMVKIAKELTAADRILKETEA